MSFESTSCWRRGLLTLSPEVHCGYEVRGQGSWIKGIIVPFPLTWSLKQPWNGCRYVTCTRLHWVTQYITHFMTCQQKFASPSLHKDHSVTVACAQWQQQLVLWLHRHHNYPVNTVFQVWIFLTTWKLGNEGWQMRRLFNVSSMLLHLLVMFLLPHQQQWSDARLWSRSTHT